MLGLPLNHVFLYVGKAKNLHRRLSQHDLRLESNPGLASYLRQNVRIARIWYSIVNDPSNLINIEKTLIRRLKPPCNRIDYKTNKEQV